MFLAPWTKPRKTTPLTSWNFLLWNGPLPRNSTITCMGVSLLSIQTITYSHMCWQRRNLMPLASDRLLLCACTTLRSCTTVEKPTQMQMAYPDYLIDLRITVDSLNIERRYSCRAMLNFEPVAPPATGGISQINKSSLVVHMWLCTCVRWLKWIANTSTICYMITWSFINKHFNSGHMILKETKLWNCN